MLHIFIDILGISYSYGGVIGPDVAPNHCNIEIKI